MPDPSTRTAGSPQLAFRQRGLLVAAILALVVGGLVGLAAVVFLEAISWVQLLALGTREEMVISGLVEQPWWRRLAGPLIGGVIVGGLMTVLYPTLSRPPGCGERDRSVRLAPGPDEFPRWDQGRFPQRNFAGFWRFGWSRRANGSLGRNHWRLGRASVGAGSSHSPDTAGLWCFSRRRGFVQRAARGRIFRA